MCSKYDPGRSQILVGGSMHYYEKSDDQFLKLYEGGIFLLDDTTLEVIWKYGTLYDIHV